MVIVRTLKRCAVRILRVGHTPAPQLELVLPATVRDVAVPPAPVGYRLRTFVEADTQPLLSLMHRSGFTHFDDKTLAEALAICLPGGCFVVQHETTATLASAMMARHLPSRAHPFGGRIDWLATDPEHRGKGLATICARSATRRLRNAGYDTIYVTTDDHRLGALKVFLDIGFLPVVSEITEKRWRRVYEALGRDPAL